MLMRCALALTALLAICSPASAGTLARSGDTLTFTGTPGEGDSLEYSLTGSGKLHLSAYTYDADGVLTNQQLVLAPGSGCVRDTEEPTPEETAVCDVPARLVADLGALGDSFTPALGYDDPVAIPMHVTGGPGEDQIVGNAGNDHLDAGAATEAESRFGQSVSAGAGDDVVLDSSFAEASLNGGEGNDTITTTAREANVSGEGGDDVITATGGDVFVIGDAGDDTLTGGEGDDHLLGDAGADVLYGAGGADTLNGYAAFGDPDGPDEIHGGAGDDVINGGPASDRLFGEAGGDLIIGGGPAEGVPSGDDLLDGGDGDDRLEPVTTGSLFPDYGGADTYVGGAGHDRFDYFWRSDPVRLSLNGSADDGALGEGDDVKADLEEVGGGSGPDVLVGSGAGDIIHGYEGDDEIRGLGGADTLDGGDFTDDVDGGAGDDTIQGGTLSDTLTGGPGRDTVLADRLCSEFGTTKCFSGDSDVIHVRDGERDTVFCTGPNGPEVPADTVAADTLDEIPTRGAGACRTIQRASVQPGAGTCAAAKAKLKKAVRQLKAAKRRLRAADGAAARRKAAKQVKTAKKRVKRALAVKKRRC